MSKDGWIAFFIFFSLILFIGIIIVPILILTPAQELAIFRNQLQSYFTLETHLQDKMIIAIMFLTSVYYLVVWYLFSRNPERYKTIMPLFEPPDNLSPAAIRFLTVKACDIKALTATIMGMMEKKFIQISKVDSTIIIERVVKDDSLLISEEKIVAKKLFKNHIGIAVSNEYKETYNAANLALAEYLFEKYKNCFFKNYGLVFPGILLILVAGAITMLLTINYSNTDFLFQSTLKAFMSLFMLPFFTLYILGVIYSVVAFVRKPPGASVLITVLFYSYIGTMLFTFYLGLILSNNALPFLTMLLLITLIIMNVILSRFLPAYTRKGRDFMRKIAGFKLFLSTTDKYKLAQFNPPTITKSLFEKYFPYAIALDIEGEWGRQISNDLADTEMNLITEINVEPLEISIIKKGFILTLFMYGMNSFLQVIKRKEND